MKYLKICIILVLLFAANGAAIDTVEPGTPSHEARWNQDRRMTIHLQYASFDPLDGLPVIPQTLKAAPRNTIRLLQVYGPLATEEIEALEQAGARLLGYVPEQVYVAHIPDQLLSRIRAMDTVRWIGECHPAYKIEPGLLEEWADETVLQVEYFQVPAANSSGDEIRSLVQVRAGKIIHDDRFLPFMHLRLPADAIVALAGLPEVRWIEKWHPPQTAMNIVRQHTGARLLHIADAFDGGGVVGEIKDNGIDQTHPDFGNLIGTFGDVILEMHGTGTFGIVFADGATGTTSSLRARGMMTGGGGVFCDWRETRYESILNLKTEWNGRFQSNSWTASAFNGKYSSMSKWNDEAINEFDVSMLYAGGNDGREPMGIAHDAVAKNVIGVGAIFHGDSADRSTHHWETAFPPCRGPAADGRVKPDLIGYYDYIFTTDVVGDGGATPADYVATFGGTSGACPIVAGAAGLVYQMCEENHFGNNPDGNIPHTATVKAILIATAYQYDFDQATRFQQGWGFPDVSRIHAAHNNTLIVDGGNPLSTGESRLFQVERYGSGDEPLKISLVWADREAEVLAAVTLVNDLDLLVTAPGGTVYHGNYGLYGHHYSLAEGNIDRRNNVENVFIRNPEPGVYTIEVIAHNVPLDNHPDDGENQDFSLCATMVAGSTAPFIVTGEGPYQYNDPLVRTWDPTVPSCFREWQAYGSGRFGVKVAAGDVDGDGRDEIITGPGPGNIYGPHVRGFTMIGHNVEPVNFLAYGTNRYGVNVAAGDVDGDGSDEIITGAGPGSVFGPHVRGWNADGDTATPLVGLSFFAYGTHRWGVNVACGDIDGDGMDEIVTGAGPGSVFGPHVRGWNHDGTGGTSPIPQVSFFAYGSHRWGVNLACGDIDGDGIDEIITGPGPSAMFGSHLRAFDHDGTGISTVPGVNAFAYAGFLYGLNLGAADVDDDGFDEILTMPGPDPAARAVLRVWDVDGGTLQLKPDLDFDAYEEVDFGFGGTIAGGRF